MGAQSENFIEETIEERNPFVESQKQAFSKSSIINIKVHPVTMRDK